MAGGKQNINHGPNQDYNAENTEMTTHLITSELSIYRTGSTKPPPTPTVEAVLTRSRLERQDTIKSNHEQEHSSSYDGCMSPVEEQQRQISKDDLDLVRKPSMANTSPFPNITITIVQPSSPPSSPPIPGDSRQSPSKQAVHSHHHTVQINQKTTTYGQSNSLENTWNSSTSKDYKSGNADSIPGISIDNGGTALVSNNSNSPSRHVKSDDPFELISFEEELFEKYFYGREHWNYFTDDEALGPVIMSLKQETFSGRDQFRLLLRTISYSLHGLVPTSAIVADRYDREAVVRALGNEAGLKPDLMLGQLPSTPDELLKLDQVFVKSELKVGVIYVQGHQVNSEEAILGNRVESKLFKEFLDILGDRIRLKGFDKYKGGLDTGRHDYIKLY